MNLSEIIKELLKKGYFVDENVLKEYSEEELLRLLSLLPKTAKPEKLTKEKITKLLFTRKIEIINLAKKGEISILDIAKNLKERYDYFYNLLVKKTFLPVFSINKIGKVKNFGIVAMVYKIDNNNLYLEDITGKLVVKNKSGKKVWEDACYLFICKKDENEIECIDIIYPELTYSSFVDNIVVTFDKESDTNEINLVISEKNESKVLNNKIYLNFDFQPVYQIKINNSLVVVVNLNEIEFDFEKITKTRIVENRIERTIKFGKDIFLLKEDPSIFILIGSENKIIKEDPLIVSISKDSIIDAKSKKIVNI